MSKKCKMKSLCLLSLLLLLPTVSEPAQTFIELGLYHGTIGGTQITNAETVIKDSHGNTVAEAANTAWPHATLSLPFDVYTISVTAPASDGYAAIKYSVTIPLATAIPGTSYTVTRYEAKFALDATGQHGTYTLSGAGSF